MFIKTFLKVLKEICALENIIADASEDSAVFTDKNLAKYDVIIFSNANVYHG